MTTLKESTAQLIERKHLLEQELSTLLTNFASDTGIWVDHLKIYKEVKRDFGNPDIVVDHWVKTSLGTMDL